MWKKIAVFLMAAVFVIGMAGDCSQAASKGYVFRYNKASAKMNGAAANFIKKAGTPNKTISKKSCAYEGKDRTYEYEDFILYTYSNSDDGPEYIGGITFLTKDVKTKEGIRIGSSYEDMVKKYGKGKENYGIYTYKKGKSVIQIEIKDGKVNNLRYLAD